MQPVTDYPRRWNVLDWYVLILLLSLQVCETLTLSHVFFVQICEKALKPVYLVGLLKSLEGEKCIVFTSSVETTRRLCKLLNFFGDSMIKAKEYSGGLNQAVRR